MANPPPELPPNEEVHSDEDLIGEVENYNKEAERDAQTQPLDPPQFAFLSRTLSYVGASSLAGGAGPSTSGAMSSGVSPRYVCEDWVSRIITGKLASIACKYRLGNLAR